MSSIGNFAWNFFYGRFAQHPEVQKLGLGVGCFLQGKRLLFNPDPASSSWKRKIAGATLIIAGAAGLYYGGQSLLETPAANLREAFLFGQNPTPSIEEDPYERSFRGPIDALYLGAGLDADLNQGLDPSDPQSLPKRVEALIPLKYKIIQHPLQICEEIRSASKGQALPNLLLQAHGNRRAMKLGPTSILQVFDSLPSTCFDGLSAQARIFLLSCRTGKSSFWQPNLAEWVSWISGNEVIAASGFISAYGTRCAKDAMGRLDVQLGGSENCLFPQFSTLHFNTSKIWTEKAIFLAKMVAPAIFGAFTSWQLGSAVLQGSGAALSLLADYGASPIKTCAQATGLYTPGRAQLLYGVTKGMSQILGTAGKVMQQAVDHLLQLAVTKWNTFLSK